MRQSLRAQTHLVKKTKVEYKNKVENLARDIVNQKGQAMYEMTLPAKYTEMMDRFKQIKDPKEVRRILLAARRQLSKAHKQLVISLIHDSKFRTIFFVTFLPTSLFPFWQLLTG
jgi:hypothetical protein